MNGLFVTGTDTGVGKTAVGAALLRLALRRGFAPIPLKPVETGCAPEPSDAVLLGKAASWTGPRSEICPVTLPVPVAPAAAAELAGTQIDIAALAAHARRLADGHPLLVEGAGGLLVPYAPHATGADLAAAIGLPLLVVARAALGTINHTALTVAEARRRQLPIAGIVLVAAHVEHTPDVPGNPRFIAELTGLRPLGTMPFVPERRRGDPDALADALAEGVDVEPLLRAFGPEP